MNKIIKFNELLDCEKKNIKPEHIKKQNNDNIPWVDKYRPAKLSEVISQDDAIKMLKNVLTNGGNLPHLLFHGPSGTGKTSSVLAIAMELFGPKKFNERVIELNASDERGINIVRNKIVTLAKTAVSSKDPNYPCPDYKIIILDEADAMTTEAQSALRKVMEDYSNITRFCFICNYINQIIDPITSRCVKFRFKSLNQQNVFDKLASIAQNEKMTISNEGLNAVAEICNGDMRKSIMILQNLNYLSKNINVVDVYDIANMVPNDKLKRVMEICVVEKFVDINKIHDLANYFKISGYPINNILQQLCVIIINSNDLTDIMKSYICLNISEVEKRLNDGADEYIQLLGIFTYIKNISLNVSCNNFD